ncbi:MAG: cytochrome C [Desulfuromonadaceae bacterium]|nr:cytochrome C [Desulfuromonadaceae bacterium]
MKLLTGLVMCGIIVNVSGAGAADLPSVERGQKLFASDKLGTSGKSCATCHKDGKELNVASTTSDVDLAGIINGCIAGPLKGKPLDPESSDMKSLLQYLKSIAVTGK